MTGDAVWVICRDYESEGFGDPMVAVRGEDEARALFAMMGRAQGELYALFRVPIYPDVVQQETKKIL